MDTLDTLIRLILKPIDILGLLLTYGFFFFSFLLVSILSAISFLGIWPTLGNGTGETSLLGENGLVPSRPTVGPYVIYAMPPPHRIQLIMV